MYLADPSFYKESQMSALVRKKKKVLGAGEYGTVRCVKVAGQKFAIKTSKISTFPKHVENTMAALREEAMTCVHPHIIERIWCRFYDS